MFGEGVGGVGGGGCDKWVSDDSHLCTPELGDSPLLGSVVDRTWNTCTPNRLSSSIYDNRGIIHGLKSPVRG